MEEKNKKMLMVGGVVVLAVAFYWYMNKNKEELTGLPTNNGDKYNNSVPTTDVSSTISSTNEVNNQRIEYIETTWSLNKNEAREIIQYVDNNIKPSADWMESTREKANNKGRSVEQQLIHEAVWMLYKKDNAKYKGKL